MSLIDEDHITQAVIASHAGAGARPALHATFAPPPSAPAVGPVATLLRALDRAT